MERSHQEEGEARPSLETEVNCAGVGTGSREQFPASMLYAGN